jgi:predicted dehydrogenase
LDFVQLMMEGEDPIHVQAMCAKHQSGWLAEDEAVIGLAYPGGRLANVHISYNQEFLVDRRVLYFEHMTARIEDSEFLWLNDDLVISPKVIPEPLHFMGARDLTGYFYNQMQEFVRAVRGEKTGCVLHNEGLRLTALAQKIITTAVRC